MKIKTDVQGKSAPKQKEIKTMKFKTRIKAGTAGVNHSETLAHG